MKTEYEIIYSIWMIAGLLRDTFTRGKYQDVILPFTLLRRLDSLLEPSKDKVLEVNARLSSSLSDSNAMLCHASGYAFYNVSPYTFQHLLLDNSHHLASSLYHYIEGFSDNIREVLEKFDFDVTIRRLEEANLLYPVMRQFGDIDLHPSKVPIYQMQSIFEGLLIRLNETVNENAGYYAPREVIQLMVAVTLSEDSDIRTSDIVRKIYDPCCGVGGMLSIAKQEILKLNPNAHVFLFGQEAHRETFALCKSDLYIKSNDGYDAENIFFGSTLSNDRLPHERFDYIYANPPFGMDWKRDEEAVKHEAARGSGGRFFAGLPRISDSQLLFLLHMLSHMKSPEEGGSHAAIVMNGSPLFTGDAGSGESEIRRWILENDWLEAIIALPEGLFYNTGIASYIWILTNCKSEQRKGKIQLIDATDLWLSIPKSIGNKKRYISSEQVEQLRDIFFSFRENERSRILPYTAFGYRKIVIDRPLRLNFQATDERIARLPKKQDFINIATRRKILFFKESQPKDLGGEKLQVAILQMLANLPKKLVKNRAEFEELLDGAIKASGLPISVSVRKAILQTLSERDKSAEICRDKAGNPEPDFMLREIEDVPLVENDPKETYTFYNKELVLGKSVLEFFKKSVLKNTPDAWIDEELIDWHDGCLGKIGYEINFSLYISSVNRSKVEEQGKRLGTGPIPLADFAISINLTTTVEDLGFEEYPNAIYLPVRSMSDVITTLSQLSSNKPSNYAQIVLNPDKALAPYVAQFFNQEIGRLIRSQIMGGSYKNRILKRKISQLPMYLPNRDIQAATIEADTKITNVISELKNLQNVAWTKPRQLSHVMSSINTLTREESFSEWLNSLPFPLASILWRYSTLGDDYKRKYETLLHFFEALAEFMATLFLSSFITNEDLFKEKCLQLQDILPIDSIEKATFGVWVKIAEFLAKESRKMLHGNLESQERCMKMFKTRNREILEMLFSSEIITILQQTNANRNEWTGHGGITGSRDNHDRHTLLENQLSKLRNVLATKWEKYSLIRPGTNKYISGIYNYRVERIVGYGVPFAEKEIKTDIPMEDGSLYLLASDELEPLKLLSLIQVTQNACYFYNRRQKNGDRFISYHFEDNSDILYSSGDIYELLQKLISFLSKETN